MRGKWVMGAAVVALMTTLGAGAAMAQQAQDASSDTATRGRLNVGDTVQGDLSPAADTDWYRVSVRPGQLYSFTLNGAENGVNDPLLVLYDADGNEIQRNDDYGGELNSRIDYAASSRGTVFVEARSYSDGETGGYTLSASASALPADNAGNGTDTRARIAPGASAEGALEYSGDRDWFRVRLAAGQSYRFALSSNAEVEGAVSDPLLVLHGPDGAEIATDDDSGGGLNSYLEYTASADGDHFLEARGYGDDATGAYVLRVGDGDIPADASTDATLSAEGDYRMGALGQPGDTDWYRLDLEEGQAVRVALDSTGDDGGVGDPLLIIYGPDSAELARNDDSGGTLNSKLEFVAPAAGSYYVEARGFGEDATGAYSLNVMAGEIGNTIDTADYLPLGAVSSVIGSDGDVDWFMFDMIEGRPYRINLTGDNSSDTLDPYLTLLDSEGNQVAVDDDGGAGFNSYLSYTSATGGTYFAAVSSFGDTGTGAYTLSLSDIDVPGNVGTDEWLLGDESDDRLSRIDMPGDRDFYGASLTAGVSYTISVSGEGDTPLADPFLTISGSDGTELVTDDDSGPGLDARLVFTPTATDAYYIQASGLGGSTGGYRVAIVRNEP